MWEAIFGFLAVAVIVDGIVKLYKIRLSTKTERRGNDAANTEMLARLEKLERRMANLETIVLDAEKKREFERAL
jgi:hypothetical protein